MNPVRPLEPGSGINLANNISVNTVIRKSITVTGGLTG